jgi:putative sigma-54 modulation protein
MKVSINSVNFKADNKLEQFIEKKVGKISDFYEGVIGSEITLKVDKAGASDNKVAEIRVQIPGYDLFAKKQSSTFEEATDHVVSALRKQLEKHKAKFKK